MTNLPRVEKAEALTIEDIRYLAHAKDESILEKVWYHIWQPEFPYSKEFDYLLGVWNQEIFDKIVNLYSDRLGDWHNHFKPIAEKDIKLERVIALDWEWVNRCHDHAKVTIDKIPPDLMGGRAAKNTRDHYLKKSLSQHLSVSFEQMAVYASNAVYFSAHRGPPEGYDEALRMEEDCWQRLERKRIYVARYLDMLFGLRLPKERVPITGLENMRILKSQEKG